MKTKITTLKVIGASVVTAVILPAVVHAQYQGTTYMVEEAQVGAVGSDNDLEGTAYQGRATAGDTAVGSVSGSAYQGVGGFTTTGEPHLEVYVNSVTIDLGTLSASTPSTTSATFWVRSYLASGYNVYTDGQPPTNESGNQISPLTGGGTSSPGSSQFGINLTANTAPTTVGAVPQQVPDATYGFGQVDANYNTANTYRYNDNERVAFSNSSSGQTLYTISYLYNITPLQAAGLYVFNQSIVVVPTY